MIYEGYIQYLLNDLEYFNNSLKKYEFAKQ